MIKFKSTIGEVDDFKCCILCSHFYPCMFMLVKFKDNPSTTNAFFLKQVSCVNIMETNNQQKSRRCHPGYSGKQCTRKYQLLIATRLVQLV